MSKHIQAYFSSEDQAEGARSSLIPYGLEQLEVGKLEKGIGRSSNLLVPFAPIQNANSTASGGMIPSTGFAGTTSTQGTVPFVINNDDINASSNEEDKDGATGSGFHGDIISDEADVSSLRYVLSAKAKDEQYDEVVSKLRTLGAYVEAL
jgi:hypothetical protein